MPRSEGSPRAPAAQPTLICGSVLFPGEVPGPAHVTFPESLMARGAISATFETAPRNDMQRSFSRETLPAATTWRKRADTVPPGQGADPHILAGASCSGLVSASAGFGLVSANNRTAIATLFVCALSVSGAIFLIETSPTRSKG